MFRGSNSGGGEIFRTRLDRAWRQHNLLDGGKPSFFPGGRAAVAWRLPPTSNSAEVKETVELYLYCSPGPSRPVIGRNLPLHLLYVIQQFVVRVAQSAYRLTTGWTVRDRIPVGTRFYTCPGRPWGPSSLLQNRYQVFPGGKVRPGRAADHSPPSSAAVMEE